MFVPTPTDQLSVVGMINFRIESIKIHNALATKTLKTLKGTFWEPNRRALENNVLTDHICTSRVPFGLIKRKAECFLHFEIHISDLSVKMHF